MKYDIDKLTLEEKILLLTGADNWHMYSANGKLPQLSLSDGPNGLRMRGGDGLIKPATAMPNLSLIANSWDKSLAYLDGKTIADDCIENGADILLAPGVNIKRTPLNGRNFEYMSEDPLLAGVMGREFIKGVQDKGVGTSLKHFCANNREKYRHVQTSEVDERALNEIYLRPFEIALEARPWTVMCSYNPVNGIYASENRKLLKDILRDKLGFNGLIMSDWVATYNPYKAISATLDLIMPHNEITLENIKTALDNGYITVEQIDFCVEHVLELIEKTQSSKKEVDYTKEERHKNAVKIAKGGITLLKNKDGILPLKKGKKYLIVGELAEKPILGGAGSAYVKTDYIQESVSDLIAKGLSGSEISYERGPCRSWARESRVFFGYNNKMYTKACDSDAVIVFVGGDDEGESFDRYDIKLKKEYEELIHNLSHFNKNIIVVVNAGSAIDMQDWIDDVKAVVYEGFAGEAANEAISSILIGETNPSGKLAETFPCNIDDTFTGKDSGNGFAEWYNDGIFVGYRYYDKHGIDVLFPFGYGLSYSEFVYENLKIEQTGDCDFTVSYDIRNVSDVDGAEISQVYVKDIISMVIRPEKELKGFEKTFIKAGETKRVSVQLDFRAFAYYNTMLEKWYVENGTFEICVGASSRDIKLKGTINIKLPDNEQQSQNY